MSITNYPRAWGPGGTNWRRRQGLVTRKRPSVSVTGGISTARPAVDPLLTRANTVTESMFAPLLARLGAQRAAAENNARSAYGVHATALENALKATAAPIASSFDTGIASAAAINDAVANRLNNVGGAAAGDLKAKLAQIGSDPAAAAALAASYTGAGNAGFAKDSADLQHLVGRRAEAGSYQGKLPGIARTTSAQALESALSQMRGEFGGQESDLKNAAVDKAFDLYGSFRGEQAAQKAQAAENQRALMEAAQKERASIRALRMAATTAAEKRRYDKMEKDLNRKVALETEKIKAQAKIDAAQIGADAKVATDNPPKPDKVTGPANQKYITVNGKKVLNPNYVPTAPTEKTTPKHVVQDIRNAVWDSQNETWNASLLSAIKGSPNRIDHVINGVINKRLRQFNINPFGKQGTNIRRGILKELSGREVEGLGTYKYSGP